MSSATSLRDQLAASPPLDLDLDLATDLATEAPAPDPVVRSPSSRPHPYSNPASPVLSASPPPRSVEKAVLGAAISDFEWDSDETDDDSLVGELYASSQKRKSAIRFSKRLRHRVRMVDSKQWVLLLFLACLVFAVLYEIVSVASVLVFPALDEHAHLHSEL